MEALIGIAILVGAGLIVGVGQGLADAAKRSSTVADDLPVVTPPKRCSACGFEIPEEATICGYCQTEVPRIVLPGE